ncbi:MAG: sulfatase-like hydrolase/transferase, partial [Gammaproteobacteria bacterium]|nr:sulfatase-like hydrolase/transferase [Gammaproteobacteria bacterium]
MPPTNLLILLSDEHAPRFLGCNGHPLVRTPHLDRLAARGTLFENAYTPSPICVSARAALATGKWVHQTGCWSSAEPYNGSPPGWAHHLRGRGHEVVAIGKLHYRSSADDNGFSEERLPMHVANEVGWVQGLLRHDPLPFADAADYAGEVGRGESDYTRYDRMVCGAACEWLRARAARRAQEPWVLLVSFVAPHYPLTAPPEFFDLYRDLDTGTVEISATGHDTAHPVAAALAEFFNYHDYFDAMRAAEARRAYFGLCSFLDHNVGQVLRALADSGCESRTRVLYTS